MAGSMGWNPVDTLDANCNGLKSESGLGVTSDSNNAPILPGIEGVFVMEGVFVIVGVKVMVGVCVIVGVMVMVGVCVIVGVGGKYL